MIQIRTTALLYGMIFFSTQLFGVTISVKHTPLTDTTTDIALTFNLDKNEYLYKDYIDISIDVPDVTLSPWQTEQETTQQYLPNLKESRPAYTNRVTVTMTTERATHQEDIDAHLHIHYYCSTATCPQEKMIPISFPANNKVAVATPTTQTIKHQTHEPRKSQQEIVGWLGAFSPSAYISNLVKTTDNLWIRLLLVFILGILVSLTPCIYPMIPITVGILHSQGTKSFWRNIARSVSYTIGMATTFACFGLLASCTGPIYGYLLGNPLFIIPMVAFLGYMGLSMFGFYEMYIPRFLQSQTTSNGTGSILSAFLFGAASGTISSPCVSPGLMLLLSIAATLGNPFMGFLLLFVFGFGTSMPLLIVGTFSSSMGMLPQAGTWMVEVKKIFGTLLLAMCVYYLNNIIPWYATLWIITVMCVLGGLFYLYTSLTTRSAFWKKVHTLSGIGFIVASMVVGMNAFQETTQFGAEQASIWITDYQKAEALAHAQNKLVFLDFWATYCSICKEINNGILANAEVIQTLEKTVPVKIDGTRPRSEPYASLQKKFHISGFPTFLLIKPETNEVVKRWGSELCCTDTQTFITELEEAIAHHTTSQKNHATFD